VTASGGAAAGGGLGDGELEADEEMTAATSASEDKSSGIDGSRAMPGRTWTGRSLLLVVVVVVGSWWSRRLRLGSRGSSIVGRCGGGPAAQREEPAMGGDAGDGEGAGDGDDEREMGMKSDGEGGRDDRSVGANDRDDDGRGGDEDGEAEEEEEEEEEEGEEQRRREGGVPMGRLYMAVTLSCSELSSPPSAR
jgi:hypothetical protein